MIQGPMRTTPYDPTHLETRIARLLVAGTYAGVALLAAGIALMAVQGVDPLASSGTAFTPEAIPGDLLALRPAGFLWAGLLIVMALPVTRVAVAAVAFLGGGERRMAAIAVAVLVVLAISVALVQGEAA
jgi:uncharacterized membrane protein